MRSRRRSLGSSQTIPACGLGFSCCRPSSWRLQSAGCWAPNIWRKIPDEPRACWANRVLPSEYNERKTQFRRAPPVADTLEFKAELKQLLHLITHSLYSHPEIFLRELVSNASDAINRVKFDSLSREDILENDKDWKIKITADKDAGTLTVSDNGIGM